MKIKVTFPFAKTRKARSGVALVIVLCFVVLLTGLVLALMSRSMSNGLISQASTNISKTDLYGHGAIDQVIGDLEQEIVDGSTAQAVGTTTIYQPKVTGNARNYVTMVPYNAGPAIYGNPASPTATSIWNNPTGGLLNLVKESANGVAFYSGANYSASGPSRAAPVNSSKDVSLNGRYVSPARWNKALLLPKQSAQITGGTGNTPTAITNDSSTDTTPVATFVAPDWILSMIDPTIAAPTVYSAAMSNPQSGSYVVGRYAYTIYNEGGLLDANAAGSPAATNSSQQAIWSRKGPQAFADLTQVPGIASVTAITPQKVVDQLVGWRNSTSAQLSSVSFPSSSYSFSSTNIDNYFKYILGLSTHFMTPGTDSTNQFSDRFFTSRQQMISFFQNIAPPGDKATQALLQDAMMYFTHYSRTLNQPSYWPDPNRPMETATYSPASNTPYNNASGPGKEDTYNPPLRSMRVTTSFTRPSGNNNDPSVNPDGTNAAAGDPLIKKRFPLSRLMWLTYKGPSANVSTSDPLFLQYQLFYTGSSSGTPPAWLTKLWKEGTTANIKNYFGLTWGADAIWPGSCWTYNHGVTSVGAPTVGKLSDARAQGREPDFFELLQSAVKVGGISNPSWPNGGSAQVTRYHQNHDTDIAYQILQLGANIIDEANLTQYPTHIEFNHVSAGGGSAFVSSIYGAMDLPYLYAYRNVAFLTGAPALLNNNPFPDPPPNTTSGYSLGSTAPSPLGTLAALTVPVIWNPYDMNGPQPVAGLAPTQLRITAQSSPLTFSSLVGRWGLTPESGGVSQPQTFMAWDTEDHNALTFSNPPPSSPSSPLYREPTALCVPNLPVGSSLALGSGNQLTAPIPEVTSAGSEGKTFIGFLLGTNWTQCFSVGTLPSTKYYAISDIRVSAPSNGITIRMEYFSGAGWIPYQEYFLDGEGAATPIGVTYREAPNDVTFLGLNNTDQTHSIWNNGGTKAPTPQQQFPPTVAWPARVLYDPRTNRWGTPQGESSQPGYRSWLQFSDLTGSMRVATVRSFTTPGNTVAGLSGSTAGWFAPNLPGSSWGHWYNGLIIGGVEQNVGNNNSEITFYEDSDGVVRRAMGGYVKFVSNNSGQGSTDDNAGTTIGLPLASTIRGYDPSGAFTAQTSVNTPVTPPTTQSQSRPIILHRPYRSVSELGYAFSDTPWRNIDFTMPESSYNALLDLFCINEDYRLDAVAAGRVDLNTRQAPVIQALLAGTYRDEEASRTPPPTGNAPSLAASEAAAISHDLVTRTTLGGTNPGFVNATITSSGTRVNVNGPQPLSNIADLVGRWVPGSTASLANVTLRAYDGSACYDGFSADLSNSSLYSIGTDTATSSYPSLGAGQTSPFPRGSYSIVHRFRETTMRALSDAGQAGTWNLMIDLVAQSGRYPTTAANAANPLAAFLVEGERHYWVHLAVDRQTGQVIDENIEVVNE